MGVKKTAIYDLFTIKEDGTLWYVKLEKSYIESLDNYKLPPNYMPSSTLRYMPSSIGILSEKFLGWQIKEVLPIEIYERNKRNQRRVELETKKNEERLRIALEFAEVALTMVSVFIPVMGLGKVMTIVLRCAPAAVKVAQFLASDEKSQMLAELVADKAFEFLAKQGFNFVFPNTAKLLQDADRISKNNTAVAFKRNNPGFKPSQARVLANKLVPPQSSPVELLPVDKATAALKAKVAKTLSKENGLPGEIGYVLNSIYLEKKEGFSPQCDADVVLAQIHIFRYAKDMVYKQNYDSMQIIAENVKMMQINLNNRQQGVKNIYPSGNPMIPPK